MQTSHPPDPSSSPLVLVVDDDHAIQEVLEMALEMEGYQVRLAGDGYEAIEKLKAEAPAIILFDMFLPRMDGLAFAAELVVVSGDDRGRQKAMQIGAEGYLLKPFTIDDLLAQVSQLLQDRADARGQIDS